MNFREMVHKKNAQATFFLQKFCIGSLLSCTFAVSAVAGVFSVLATADLNCTVAMSDVD